MPVLLISASMYAYYVDLPLMAFTIVSVFCAIVAVKHNETKWYLFSGISSALAILSKEGGYISFFISLCVISLMLSRKYRLLSVAIAAIPFYFFIVRNALTLTPLNSLYYTVVVFKQIPIALLLAVLAFVMAYIPTNHESINRDVLKKLAYFIVPIAIVVFFVLRNWLFFNSPTIYSNLVVYSLGVNPSQGPLQFLRFDLLFELTGLGNIYLFTTVFGFAFLLIMLIKRKKAEVAIIPIALILLLMDWSFFYNLNFDIAEIRRLLIFTPFISIASACGFSYLLKHFPIKQKNVVEFAPFVLCFLALCFISIYQLEFVRLSDNYLSYITLKSSGDLLTFPMITASLLVITLTGIAILFSNKIASTKVIGALHFNKLSHQQKIAISSALLILFTLISLIPLNAYGVIENASKSNWSSDEYAKNALLPSWFGFTPEIIDYYKRIPDNYITVSYGIETTAIAYFSNHKVVNIDQGFYGYEFITTNDAKTLVDSLFEHNIRYVLVPNKNAQDYAEFVNASAKVQLFRLAQSTDYFSSVKNFTCYSLYELNESKVCT
jgi:hypothetical protein